MRVSLTLKSSNAKVGPIPVSTTSAETCPDVCPLKAKGCYAKAGHYTNLHWQRVTEGKVGYEWSAFVDKVAALPDGTLWRHNVAGDLPGAGDTVDAAALAALVSANAGKRGFTYTHKPVDGGNLAAIRSANAAGFTVNLSADTLAEADQLADTGAGPVVVVLALPEGIRHDVTTPAGRKVATCPATYRDDVTCASCGLCQRADRKVIVGFPAHGSAKKAAAAIAAA